MSHKGARGYPGGLDSADKYNAYIIDELEKIIEQKLKICEDISDISERIADLIAIVSTNLKDLK